MNVTEKTFVTTVWKYYKNNGRRNLPWRKTKNPYYILVSEVMLQQTQVDRVIPKYKSFLKKFPTIKKLSETSLGNVLREWQGLGYNRRAKMLHRCAQEIMREHNGRFPKTREKLMKLSGIGEYTAGAVLAFACNVRVPIIETNIRTVFIHHFFTDNSSVSDTQVLELVLRTLDVKNPREWYYALMDYGAYIKKEFGNPNSRSKHYIKQPTFKNSDRQIRGLILRLLVETSTTRKTFHQKLPFDSSRIDAQLERLAEEEMIVKNNTKYYLPV